ncbi:hypothetical protein DL768_010768 [Monosporascus sp. mg162]|nr:hypothetical protein DL768_010768 [Monosporascus sp. mg162]
MLCPGLPPNNIGRAELYTESLAKSRDVRESAVPSRRPIGGEDTVSPQVYEGIMSESTQSTTMEQPRQRLACDRCHALKLRCPRVNGAGGPSGAQCARCLKAGSLCVYSAPARLGRPLGSSQSSSASYNGAANRKKSGSNSMSIAPGENISVTTHMGPSNTSNRDPIGPLDDFLSDLLPMDAEGAMDAWNNTSFLAGSSHRPASASAHHDLLPGAMQFHLSSQDITSHGPPVSPDRQQHLVNATADQHNTGNAVDKCAECSAAMMQIDAPDSEGDPIQDIMSQLSSLTVAIHCHSRRVHGQLRVLQLRLGHKHAVVDDSSSRPITSHEIAAASDCFSTHALIRTIQSFRDIVRQMKTISQDNENILPSPASTSSRDANTVPTGSSTFGTMLPQYPRTPASNTPNHGGMSKDQNTNSHHDEFLNGNGNCYPESPNSCQLALTLALNCYLEILYIFTMTFGMISTTINHYPSALPLSVVVPAFTISPGNMLDASFSIFTATQLTNRLFEMAKKDMRDAWERYRSRVLPVPGDGDLYRKRTGNIRPNPAIHITFRLSWEKEAAITRLIEDINDQLNPLMDMS